MLKDQFAKQEEIQHIIDGFEKLYNYMLESGKINIEDIKTFIEPYFVASGYRVGGGV